MKIKYYESITRNEKGKFEVVDEDEALDYVLEKLGLEIKPIGKNGEETLEQTEFKEMLVEWYFSGNWVIKWEDVD